jgi:hypothetical protein
MMDRIERLWLRTPVSQFRERVVAFTRTAAFLFVIVLVALDFVTPMFAQTPGLGAPGLPMAEVRACAIEYRSAVALQGRWGGQIALYDATTDAHGVAVVFKRRIIEGREHLPPLVKLEQFEECVQRWRFDGRGAYEVSLLGGTVWGGEWVIQVKKGNRVFRLRMPVAKLAG